MQISLKNAVIAALAVGGTVGALAANAATVSLTSPTAGTGSQLVFWVTDLGNNNTFADVLTQTVGNMFTPTGTGAAGVVNQYNGDANFSLNIGADASLVNFINAANTAGQTLTWGITAGSVSGTGPGSTIMIVTGSGANAGADSTTILKSSLANAIGTAGWAGDANNLNGQTTDGSAFNATLNGVIGTPGSKSGTNTTYYGAYPDQAGLALTASSTLYAITNQSGQTNGTSFGLGTASLVGSGASLLLEFTGNSNTAVPLPAAVWLFGSGLLGLVGVGRRRVTNTQAA
jgi:hypothetical protein